MKTFKAVGIYICLFSAIAIGQYIILYIENNTFELDSIVPYVPFLFFIVNIYIGFSFFKNTLSNFHYYLFIATQILQIKIMNFNDFYIKIRAGLAMEFYDFDKNIKIKYVVPDTNFFISTRQLGINDSINIIPIIVICLILFKVYNINKIK